MKRTLLTAACSAALAVSVSAQEPSKDFFTGQVNLGVGQQDLNTNSSKFLEYRDVPNGAFSPYFKIRGEKDAFRYDFLGENVRQLDEHYRARLEKDWFRLDGDYNRIPHHFGNGGRSLEQQTSPGVFQISDTLQQSFQNAITAAPRSSINFAFLSALVSPSLAAAAPDVDLTLNRERSRLAMKLTPDDKVNIRLSYFHELRNGDRAAAGTSFGFGNVVENPEPLHYITQDIGADAEINGTWGVARAGVHYNWFRNRIQTITFDNPFRATDATDASAYTAPASGSIGGAAVGRLSLPPDNGALTGSIGATFKFGKNTRLSTDVVLGRWTQDSSPFIAYTTNTAITAPFNAFDPGRLPARNLDGKVDTASLAGVLTSRLADHLNFTVRYRLYDFKNKTTEILFPGYVRFDAVWEDIPIRSVPYGYKNQRLEATLAYDFGKVTLEGGYRFVGMDREFRETEKTKENTGLVAINIRPADWGVLRASYEKGKRDYDGLEIERSEDASFQNPGPPVNVLSVPANDPAFAAVYASLGCVGGPCNLRFDQAKKDTDRFNSLLQLSPGDGKVTLGLTYQYNKDDYTETRYGLTLAKYNTFTGEIDYTPTEKWSVYGFYTFEQIENFQRGRQSAATISTNRLDDWTSSVTDKVNAFGAGANLTFVPEKWTASLFGRWQKVDGNNDIFSAPGGAPANARVAFGGVQSIPIYDDTKILTLNAEVRYQLSKSWIIALGGFYEDYTVADANTSGLVNYTPGSFFLSANDNGYTAKWGYVRMSYRW